MPRGGLSPRCPQKGLFACPGTFGWSLCGQQVGQGKAISGREEEAGQGVRPCSSLPGSALRCGVRSRFRVAGQAVRHDESPGEEGCGCEYRCVQAAPWALCAVSRVEEGKPCGDSVLVLRKGLWRLF